MCRCTRAHTHAQQLLPCRRLSRKSNSSEIGQNTRMHPHSRARAHSRTHALTSHKHAHTHPRSHPRINTRTRARVRTHTWAHATARACMHAGTRPHIHTHARAHTHTQTRTRTHTAIVSVSIVICAAHDQSLRAPLRAQVEDLDAKIGPFFTRIFASAPPELPFHPSGSAGPVRRSPTPDRRSPSPTKGLTHGGRA